MKKQILFLAMLTVAIMFAGTNKVFGQVNALVPSSSTVPPISCADPSDPSFVPQPLHPFAGVPYTYSLDGAAGETPALSYTWWVTKDPGFIPSVGTNNLANRLTPPAILAPGSTYGVTTPAATTGADEVTLTWSANILSATEYQGDASGWATATSANPTPTFVVGYVEGDACADNIQVYEIAPLPNFVIDIAPIDPATSTVLGWDDDGTTAKECVDEVQSATYNSGTNEIDINYGTNTIYYEVAAANYVKNWTPTFQIVSGLATTQTAVISMYNTLADATGTGTALWTSASIGVGGMNTDIATGIALSEATPADATTGVSVWVKVVITNNTEESLTSSPFELAVDAIDNDAAGIWDMEDDDCATASNAADQIDTATITITPRPQLDDATNDTLTNPDTYIIKTN
jgi:hypothetical protein